MTAAALVLAAVTLGAVTAAALQPVPLDPITVAALALSAAALGALLVWRRHCLSLVAQASHELRGPLQAALLGLHGLGDPGDGTRLAAIDLELRRAARAVEDLSAAAGGRRAAESATDVELGELLEDAGSAWELLAVHRGVHLVVEAPARPLVVRADRLRIAQALANLVANAVEHGGGEVRVRARAVAAGARIEVTDGGPGLPAPLAELVAAARGRRDRRGHGLALAAVIAERHGGRLVTAPSPSGARLVLELPLASAEPAAYRAQRGRPFTRRPPGRPRLRRPPLVRALPAGPRLRLPFGRRRPAGARLRRLPPAGLPVRTSRPVRRA
jgi:signal transduction histidine kinase